MNKITGTVDVQIDGQVYPLRYTWECLAAIEDAHGSNPNLFDVETVASVAAIGFQATHPELTAGHIKELSPPLLPFAKRVQQALEFAYFGPEGMPEEEEVKKKLTRRIGLFSRIARRLKAG